jgi:DNA polymerase type B, organellar and viral
MSRPLPTEGDKYVIKKYVKNLKPRLEITYDDEIKKLENENEELEQEIADIKSYYRIHKNTVNRFYNEGDALDIKVPLLYDVKNVDQKNKNIIRQVEREKKAAYVEAYKTNKADEYTLEQINNHKRKLKKYQREVEERRRIQEQQERERKEREKQKRIINREKQKKLKEERERKEREEKRFKEEKKRFKEEHDKKEREKKEREQKELEEKKEKERLANPIRYQWLQLFNENKQQIERGNFKDYDIAVYTLPYVNTIEKQEILGDIKYNTLDHKYEVKDGNNVKENGLLARYSDLIRDIVVRIFPESLNVIREKMDLKESKNNPIQPYVKIMVDMHYKTYNKDDEAVEDTFVRGDPWHLLSYLCKYDFTEELESKNINMIPGLSDKDVLAMCEVMFNKINFFLATPLYGKTDNYDRNEIDHLDFKIVNYSEFEAERERNNMIKKAEVARENRKKGEEKMKREQSEQSEDVRPKGEQKEADMKERLYMKKNETIGLLEEKKVKKGGNLKRTRNGVLTKAFKGHKIILVPSFSDNNNCLLECFKWFTKKQNKKMNNKLQTKIKRYYNNIRKLLKIEEGPIGYDVETIEKLCKYYEINCEVYSEEDDDFQLTDTKVVIDIKYPIMKIVLLTGEFFKSYGNDEEIGHYGIIKFAYEQKFCNDCITHYYVKDNKNTHKCRKARLEYVKINNKKFYRRIENEYKEEKQYIMDKHSLRKVFKTDEYKYEDVVIFDIETFVNDEERISNVNDRHKAEKKVDINSPMKDRIDGPLKVYCNGWLELKDCSDKEIKDFMMLSNDETKNVKEMKTKLMEKAKIMFEEYNVSCLEYFIELIKKSKSPKIIVAYNGVMFDFIEVYRILLESKDIEIISHMVDCGRVRFLSFRNKPVKEDLIKIEELKEKMKDVKKKNENRCNDEYYELLKMKEKIEEKYPLHKTWDPCRFLDSTLAKCCETFKIPKELSKDKFDHQLIKGMKDVQKYKDEIVKYNKMDIISLSCITMRMIDKYYSMTKEFAINNKMKWMIKHKSDTEGKKNYLWKEEDIEGGVWITDFMTISQFTYNLWVCTLECLVLKPRKDMEDFIKLSEYGGKTTAFMHKIDLINDSKVKERLLDIAQSGYDEKRDYNFVKSVYLNHKRYLIKYDVNSLYPSSMLSSITKLINDVKQMTDKELKEINETKVVEEKKLFTTDMDWFTDDEIIKIEDDVINKGKELPDGFFEIDITPNNNINYPILADRDKNKNIRWHLYRRTNVYDSNSIREALKKGYVLNGIKKGIKSVSRHPVFDKIINYLYENRLIAQKNKDEMMSLMYKLQMNSLYGKMGQKARNSKSVICESALDEKLFYLDYDYESKVEIYKGKNLISGERKTLEPSGKPIQIACEILSNSKSKMIRLREKLDPTFTKDCVIYQDTDSLVVWNEDAYKLKEYIGKEIGKIKDEYDGGKILFIQCNGPKSYCELVVNDPDTIKKEGCPIKFVMKIKGIDKKYLKAECFDIISKFVTGCELTEEEKNKLIAPMLNRLKRNVLGLNDCKKALFNVGLLQVTIPRSMCINRWEGGVLIDNIFWPLGHIFVIITEVMEEVIDKINKHNKNQLGYDKSVNKKIYEFLNYKLA